MFDQRGNMAMGNLGGRNEVRSLDQVELTPEGHLEMFWFDAM